MVAIHGVRELHDGNILLEMEHVEGGSVADHVASDGRIDPLRAAALLRDVLRGVARRGDTTPTISRAIHQLESAGPPALAEQARINLAEIRAAFGDLPPPKPCSITQSRFSAQGSAGSPWLPL